jgi:hypothetical protein
LLTPLAFFHYVLFFNERQDALTAVVSTKASPDVMTRAADLFSAVVSFVTAADNTAALPAVVTAFGPLFVAPYVAHAASADRDVASRFAAPLGVLLGCKQLATSGAAADALPECVTKYVATVAILLAAVAGESSTERSFEMPDASVVSAAAISASIGYIPTVNSIADSMPSFSAGDAELERVLSGLSAFLATENNRFAFCKHVTATGSSATEVLSALLDREVSLPVQPTYQAVFCLWLLSFASQQGTEPAISTAVASAMEEAAVPRRLTAVLRDVVAEKVVRVTLATLRNIMRMSTVLRKEMVGADLGAALESLSFRRWNDEDIREDLKVLADSLECELTDMSTFDVYRHEVLSGALKWTPAHRDETFWRENVEKLDSHNLEVLRCMVRLLNQSSDVTVLSVACHDLAQFVKYHPRGRFIAQSLGVKVRLMQLMTDGHPEVRRYALNTVQILMISNWNLMQRTS